jgi:hypothetical protein
MKVLAHYFPLQQLNLQSWNAIYVALFGTMIGSTDAASVIAILKSGSATRSPKSPWNKINEYLKTNTYQCIINFVHIVHIFVIMPML